MLWRSYLLPLLCLFSATADDPTKEPADSKVTVLTYDSFYRFVEQVSVLCWQ